MDVNKQFTPLSLVIVNIEFEWDEMIVYILG